MQHEYEVTLVILTNKTLTHEQVRAMEEEIKRAVDAEANLPLDADLATSSARYVARMP